MSHRRSRARVWLAAIALMVAAVCATAAPTLTATHRCADGCAHCVATPGFEAAPCACQPPSGEAGVTPACACAQVERAPGPLWAPWPALRAAPAAAWRSVADALPAVGVAPRGARAAQRVPRAPPPLAALRTVVLRA